MTTQNTNRTHTNNTQGGVSMSAITKFAMVQSVKAFNTVSKSYVQVPAQIKMEIARGNKTQVVSFGHARTGGRGLYMTVDGGTPVSITKRDFLDKLRSKNTQGLDVVLTKLSKLNSLHSDRYVVAKCECCGEATVTGANMDFMQRNHKKLSERLGRELHAFSKVCYACQGKGPKQPKAAAPKELVVKETAVAYVAPQKKGVADCAACGKAIESQRIVDFSVKEYGHALCFGKCQNDAKRASAASATPTCKTCTKPADTLHASGQCENCWSDEMASEASHPYVGHASILPFPDVPAAPLKPATAVKQELDPELAEMAHIEIDTADLNAVLDADAQVTDFLNLEGEAAPAAPKKSTLYKPMTEEIKIALDQVNEEAPADQKTELARILEADESVMDFMSGVDAPAMDASVTSEREEEARSLFADDMNAGDELPEALK